jgi:uncharacterized protein (TIGR02466 family)
MQKDLLKIDLFQVPIYFFQNNLIIDELNKNTDSYIKEALDLNKEEFINNNNKDFGLVHHSKQLHNDQNFNEFIKFILEKANYILDEQGYNLSNYNLKLTELWAQEFSKDGGGHHSIHTHWNGHISGFYFLKCSEKTSFPIFHDPRQGKIMIQLPEKNQKEIGYASEKIHFKPKPGTFIFFNSYLGHEFAVDYGIEPFRFIHFNIQAVSK